MARSRRRPLVFRLYGLGCGLGIAGVIAAVILIGWFSMRQVTTVSMPMPGVPRSISPLVIADPLPPAPDGGTSVTLGGDVFAPGARRVRLEIWPGNLPEELAPAVRALYGSFGAAVDHPTGGAVADLLLPSVDLVSWRTWETEEAAIIGIESAFVRGLADAEIRPLADFLTGLATHVAAEARVAARPAATAGAAEARALFSLALEMIDADSLPAVDAARRRELREQFDAWPPFSEPRGAWRRTEALRDAWRALHVLMMPLSPDAVQVVLHAMAADSATGGWLRAHYDRWTAVRKALHGGARATDLTIAAALAGRTASDSDLALLAPTGHAPPDALLLAADPRTADPAAGVVATRATDQVLADFARAVSLGALDSLPANAGWRDWQLHARLPGVPLAPADTPLAASPRLSFGAGYKLLRATGQPAPAVVDAGLRLDLGSAFGCQPSRPALQPPEIRLEPLPRTYLRMGRSLRVLPALLEPALGVEAVSALRAAPLPGLREGERLRDALDRAAWFCFALHRVACAVLGHPDDLQDGERPGEALQTEAIEWLRDGCRVDPTLAADVTGAHLAGYRGDGASIWIGIRGVVLQPVIVRMVDDDAMPDGTRTTALLPMLDRTLYVTDGPPPAPSRWSLLARRLGRDALDRLHPAAQPLH